MSLLTMCQDAADICGVVQPATIISNSNTNAKRLLQAAEEETLELASEHPWGSLVREGTITLVSGTQNYTLPADCWYVLADTMWDETEERIVFQAVSSKEWRFLKGRDFVTSINRRGMIRADVDGTREFIFFDTIGAADDTNAIKFDYISDQCISIATLATRKEAYTIDTDIPNFLETPDHRLITFGIVWRFKEMLGLPFETSFAKYERYKKKIISRDKNPRSLNLMGQTYATPLGVVVSDHGYG